MEQQLVRISRFLSYVLRHHPEAEGLSMDEHGWVMVDALLSTRGARKRCMTQDLLAHVVAENDKQRFEFDDSGDRIRARQGHSRAVEIGWNTAVPPEYLYHGTSIHAIPSIREQGLQKRNRHHVHLSVAPETAKNVGARHGQAVVLTIRTKEMYEAGHQFFISANGIWLVDAVPPEFIEFPELSGVEKC